MERKATPRNDFCEAVAAVCESISDLDGNLLNILSHPARVTLKQKPLRPCVMLLHLPYTGDRYRLYRDACMTLEGNYLKDLNVLGRDLSKVAIVDNSPYAYGFQVGGVYHSFKILSNRTLDLHNKMCINSSIEKGVPFCCH